MISSVFTYLEMRRNLRLSPDELRNLQNKKLRRLVRHAFENVPYYQRLFNAAGITPDDINGVQDLSKIPVSTKRDLQKSDLSERTARGSRLEDCTKISTSGSTGTPFSIYRSKAEARLVSLLYFRAHTENGYRITDRMVGLAGSQPKLQFRVGLLQKLGLFRRETVSIFLPIEERIERLRALRPGYLWGIKSGFQIVANEIVKRGIRMPPPRLLVPGGENLDEKTRKLLEKAFGVKPTNYYGTTELGPIAWECEQRNGMHIDADYLLTEFAKGGKIICTNLFQFTTPLIRYDLGDVCVPTERQCPCGRTLPLIQEIIGRADDFIYTPDGQVLNWQSFHHHLAEYEMIRQYRIIQKTKNTLSVIFAADDAPFDAAVRRFKKDFQSVIPASMSLEFQRVDKIDADPSGKLRTVISKVGQEN